MIQAKSSWYHCRFRVRGREYRRSTGIQRPAKCTGPITASEKRSAPYRAAWKIHQDLLLALQEGREVEKLRHDRVLTVGGLLEHWDRYAAEAQQARRIRDGEAPRQALLRVLATAYRLPESSAAAGLELSKVGRFAATHFQDLASAADRPASSINAELRQARQVFSRRARDYYRSAGLELDDSVEEFLEVPHLAETLDAWAGMTGDQVKRMDSAALAWEEDYPDLLAAYALMRWLGLRNSEALHARWSWVTRTGDRWFLTVGDDPATGWRPKAANSRRSLPLESSVRELLLRCSSPAAPDDYLVIPGKPSRAAGGAAANLLQRRLGEALTPYLPAGERKKAYQLRKLAGSEVLTASGSIEATAKFLGNTVGICRRHYARYLHEVPSLGPAMAPPAPLHRQS